MKENEKISLNIKRLGINGEGIGYFNRLAIFVDGAIPGEVHDVKITKALDKMAYASTLSIKKESEARVNPKCPYYKDCGGCGVMHIDYNKMLEYKKEAVIEALNRYTNLNTRQFEIKDTISSDLIYNYRNKSLLPVKKIDSNYSVCMIKEKSNVLVPIKDCLVQNSVINDLNNKILAIADELNIPPYLAKFNRGVLRYISIRVNEKNEALVCFICYEKNEKIKELAKRVLELNNVKSVYENFNTSIKQTQIFGDETNHLCGDKSLILTLNNIKYELYPTTFFQLNTNQAKKLFEIVKKACKLSRKEVVLDAFSGVGAIGLYLANMAKEVIGVEYNEASVVAANKNAKLNKINNANFICADANKLLPKMVDEGKVFDVVVVDPPRVGLGDEFIKTLKKTKVKRVVYVSCNPTTLAKDLEELSDIYKVNSIQPLDMFPNTPLCEAICLLNRRND